MIYVTGDTHIPIDIEKLDLEHFPEQKNMDRNDYVIVLGDFGLYWKNDEYHKEWRDWIKEAPYTLLWIDGNHENFDWIETFPISEWHGGQVQQTEENIIHLMRGECYEIEGLHFLTLGGAQSYDREMRIAHISWWPRELWTYEQEQRAFDTIQCCKDCDVQIDYVLSHTCPNKLIKPMFNIKDTDHDPTCKFLTTIWKEIGVIKGWYFGHWHEDKDYNQFHSLYNRVIRIN